MGLMRPFLSFVIVFIILTTEMVDHLQIGSYLYDKTSRGIDTELSETEEEATGEELDVGGEGGADKGDAKHSNSDAANVRISRKLRQLSTRHFDLVGKIYLNNTLGLYMSVWRAKLVMITFFVSLILFDMVADVYSIIAHDQVELSIVKNPIHSVNDMN
jgi:hypothetical protein